MNLRSKVFGLRYQSVIVRCSTCMAIERADNFRAKDIGRMIYNMAMSLNHSFGCERDNTFKLDMTISVDD